MIAKRKIRTIDSGTVYDIPGNLRRLTRLVERGEEGRITNMIVIYDRQDVTSRDWQRQKEVVVKHYGIGDRRDAHWLISTAKNRLEPA